MKFYRLPSNETNHWRMEERARILTRLILDGTYASFHNHDLPRRKPYDVVVAPLAWNRLTGSVKTLGLVERWVYADRPDLGVFGTEFIPDEHARRYL